MVKKTDKRMRPSYVGINSTFPTSFFKLMIPPTFHSYKLRLPETFASEFRDDLSEVCHLKVPTGETHQVALVEEDNQLWFRDGWEKFVDRFSIDYGFFITFTYHGKSKFGVSIFNLSACEISYECHGKAVELDSDDDETNSEELNVINADTEEDSKEGSQMEIDSDDDEMNSREGTETNFDMSEKGFQGSRFGTSIPVWLKPFKAKLKDVIAAGIPIPANPFFVAVIRPYNLISGGFLNVPRTFARVYMNCRAKDSIMVETSDGSRWVVRCCKNRTYCSLGRGWTQICQNADLEIDDVCLLELTDAQNLVLKLYVVKLS